CSTPTGVNETFTRQPAGAVVDQVQCSTPTGVNETFTSRPGARSCRREVLNAYRRQRNFHSPAWLWSRHPDSCSTPTGVNETFTTGPRTHSSLGICAQRLPASTKLSLSSLRLCCVWLVCSTPTGVNETFTLPF